MVCCRRGRTLMWTETRVVWYFELLAVLWMVCCPPTAKCEMPLMSTLHPHWTHITVSLSSRPSNVVSAGKNLFYVFSVCEWLWLFGKMIKNSRLFAKRSDSYLSISAEPTGIGQSRNEMALTDRSGECLCDVSHQFRAGTFMSSWLIPAISLWLLKNDFYWVGSCIAG